ncbi:zinc finger CCHC domain-containing protein 12-like [Pseudorasbora parva]|uniref:zinc finger CCHC domain-containing protein 12-like n=1 Tax=Pseudorasbora parva TaxID=51549 RepID=UPI00351EF4AF
MDVVERESVNVKNAVLVSGITLTELDQVLEAYLLRFGSIQRNLLIDDPRSEFHRNAVVEFSHNSAMCNLEPHLPLTMVNPTDPDTVFRVRTLSSVYTPAVSNAATEYLEKLQAIASVNGESLQDMLQRELIRVSGMRTGASPRTDLGLEHRPLESNLLTCVTSTPQRLEECKSPSVLRTEPENPVKTSIGAVSPHCSNDPNVSSAETISVKFPMTAAHPPGIQRVVMEHIVRTSDPVSPHNASFRLKSFSGRSPRPNNEPDFDTWRVSVDYLLNDPSLPESHKTRKILDSLLPPASDIIKHVNLNAPSIECLRLLESVYGSVEDGDELLARFISTLQNPGEKSSAYLHRLHVILSTTIRRDGVAESERDRCLLRQFCRGCWDNALIADLQLEKRKADPPPFAELAILIRTAEDKQTSKEERMRKHLGMNKHPSVPLKLRTASHQQSAYCSTSEEDADSPVFATPNQKASKQKVKTHCPETSEVGALKKEVAALQSQVAAIRTAANQDVKERAQASELQELKGQIAELKIQVATSGTPRNQPERSSHLRNSLSRSNAREVDGRANGRPQYGEASTNRPRPWYCFRCGEDGHLANNCENPPNSLKVEEKRRKLRERQAEWDLQNKTTTVPLN